MSLIRNQFEQLLRAKYVFCFNVKTSSETRVGLPLYFSFFFNLSFPLNFWGNGSSSLPEVKQDAFSPSPVFVFQSLFVEY